MASKSTKQDSDKDVSEKSPSKTNEAAPEEEIMEAFGKCKWFKTKEGYGFVTPDDVTATEGEEQTGDIFVHQSVIQMPGFRNLKQGEAVQLWYKRSPLGLEATKVCGPNEENCIGTRRRPHRNPRTYKCYNCGEEGHHAKQCTMSTMPKKCHHCESIEHLIKHCPLKNSSTDKGENNESSTSNSPQKSPNVAATNKSNDSKNNK